MTNQLINTSANQQIWQWLNEVLDPEVPVLSVVDLGIIRDVKIVGDLTEIIITPTYSGCPATKVIEDSVKDKLVEKGIVNFKITTQISPPWTTDWLTEAGKQKLEAYGIAPPVGLANKKSLLGETPTVKCPLCKSQNTKMLSQFGSTPCKSLYQCKDCLEPFDYFKCI